MDPQESSASGGAAKSLTRIAFLASAYLALAFAFSFVGFVAQQPTVHFHEYSFPQAVEEVGGHFLFGAAAAAPFLSLPKSVLSGALAIAIDADHILGSLNLSVSSRPDHSLSFAVFATLLMWAIASRLDRNDSVGSPLGVAVLVPVSMLSHVSYDIFAAYLVFSNVGSSFPMFAPLSFSLIAFPFWAFAPLEAGAVGLSALFAFRLGNSRKPNGRKRVPGRVTRPPEY